MMLEIHGNKHCKAARSTEWDQIHEKSASQIGGWCAELEEIWMQKSEKL